MPGSILLAGNTSKENSLERTLSSSLEFTSPGSLYSLLSLPIKLCIHFTYLHLEKGIVLGRINFFKIMYIWMLRQLFFLFYSFPSSPTNQPSTFDHFILTFDTFIWQSIILQTQVSNALFTERPLPWQMSL